MYASKKYGLTVTASNYSFNSDIISDVFQYILLKPH